MEMRRRPILTQRQRHDTLAAVSCRSEIRNIGGTQDFDGCRSYRMRAIAVIGLRQIDRLKTPND